LNTHTHARTHLVRLGKMYNIKLVNKDNIQKKKRCLRRQLDTGESGLDIDDWRA